MVAKLLIVALFIFIIKKDKNMCVRKALIIGTDDELMSHNLNQYFQKGSIVEVISNVAGNHFCLCKTLDGSTQKAVHRSLLFSEYDFVKIVENVKSSAIPKAHYGRVARVLKILDEATIMVVVMNKLEYSMKVTDLAQI